jgi:uncharacterized protein YdeI (YjbR/CyaY-like superfamily)
LVAIPEDLTHAIDRDRDASGHWRTLSRDDREVLGWYVDQSKTRWGRRRRTAEVLRMLRAGQSVGVWQTLAPGGTFTSAYGYTVSRNPPR